ncbi:MAG: TRAP transporter substrate-binding protein [Planctomycetota bacterium]|jgi:tripartite ATP-independent transporter DctP family solute receptor|nr:TRAP transporter substrate-binding protein [Planctomycetota bacterium]
MLKSIGKLLFALLLTLSLSGAGRLPAADAITLKFGFVDPAGSMYALGGSKVAEEVDRATGGKIKIEVYASGTLGNERDMYEGCQIGTIDMCSVVNVVLSSFIPELKILDQPFLFDNVEQAHKVIDGKFGELIDQKAQTQGVHLVGWMESGFRNVFSNRPITKVEDFKGFKIRTMENQMQIATFNALGAIATPMAAGEQFTALQQGTIDGNENAVANMLTNRYYEVIKNVTWTNHLYTFIAIGMSDKAWNRVPADLRPQFLAAVKRGIDYQRQLLLDGNAAAVKELTEKRGVKFHNIDLGAVRGQVAKVIEDFRKTLNPEIVKVVEEAKK